MATSGGRRDLNEFDDGFLRWLRARRPDLVDPRIDSSTHPSAGLSNETIIVTLDNGERLVVRLPPLLASFPETTLAAQAIVHDVVAEAGIPTAAPVHVEPDEQWLGVPFIVMPFVEGHIPGPASLFDRWILDAPVADQRRIQEQMINVLAAVHRIDWRSTPVARALRGEGSSMLVEIGWWSDYVTWAADGDAPERLVDLLSWCSATAPTHDPEPSLVWGDARLENLMFDEQLGIVAVLDWELATIGPAEQDLGWYLALERALFEMTGSTRTIPGFRGREELIADYESRLGRPVQDLAWHEIFSLVRSVCITFRQARISKIAGVEYLLPELDGNPMLDIVDRWIAAY